MKILHVPFGYYPGPVGGTEIYVASLARVQRNRGLQAFIAAPGGESTTYLHDGVEVHRIHVSSTLKLRELYGEGDSQAAAGFAEVLRSVRPDVVHLHAFTSGVSIRLVREARRNGIPVVFTYHTPTVTCTRGTLLRWGVSACDGEMQVHRCARCTLHGKGVPLTVSWMLGSLPQAAGACAGAAGLTGGPWTALRSTELIGLRHSAARELFAEVDHVVAVCHWVRDLLVRNGVSEERITLSRHGLPYPVDSAQALESSRNSLLKLVFLGRLDAVKGLEVVIDALAARPALAVTLDIFGVIQGAEGQKLEAKLRRKAAGDPRIRFQPAVAANEVVECLRPFDALLVPSLWLETGPLVVYEAFAAGIPVIGSDLGGIAELVQDGETGILVEAGSVDAWAKAITLLVERPGLLEKLRASAKPVRTAEDVATDMDAVYSKVLCAVSGAVRN